MQQERQGSVVHQEKITVYQCDRCQREWVPTQYGEERRGWYALYGLVINGDYCSIECLKAVVNAAVVVTVV